MQTTDPMERIVADALDAAGISYATDLGGGNPSGLDFRLAGGVEIEVKRFHSPRIAEQMSRAENVIAIQGIEAARFFAALLHRVQPKRNAQAIEARRAETVKQGSVHESAVPERDAP